LEGLGTRFEKESPFGLPKNEKDEKFFILPNNPYFTALEKISFYEKVIRKIDDSNSYPAISNYRKELDN